MFIEFDNKLIPAQYFKFVRGEETNIKGESIFKIFALHQIDSYAHDCYERFNSKEHMQKRWDEIRLELNVIKIR